MFRPVARVGERVPVVTDGYKNPPLPGERFHPGIDIIFRRHASDPKDDGRGTQNFYLPVGAEIVACYEGTVTRITSPERGYRIYLQHGSGDLDGYTTVYEHLTGDPYVRVGDTVQSGQTLGMVGWDLARGSPGRANPMHCHWEVIKPGGMVDAWREWRFDNPQNWWNRFAYFPPRGGGPIGDLGDGAADTLAALVSRIGEGDIETLMFLGGTALLLGASS